MAQGGGEDEGVGSLTDLKTEALLRVHELIREDASVGGSEDDKQKHRNVSEAEEGTPPVF